jgi:23S rRNA (adenine2503-C2)-methyltransferase
VKRDLRDLTPDELTALMAGWGEKPFRVKQLQRWLWREPAKDFDGLTDLPLALRRKLAEQFHLNPWRPVKGHTSSDGTRKFLFQLDDGLSIESVLIPERDHTTLCISTQVGCRMGCAFCRTARIGFRRNLSPGEILGQILHARSIAPPELPLTNLVFMGMGEPLDNYDNLKAALAVVFDTAGLGFGHRRVTVSTVGLPDMIRRLGRDTKAALAVSLSAADDDLRSRLMPINRKYPLAQLKAALMDYPLVRGRRITIEYVLLAGVNDSPAHARALIKFLHGLKVKINLIPFNPAPDLPYEKPEPAAVEIFSDKLHAARFTVMVRRSMGADVAAACGQLAADRLDS